MYHDISIYQLSLQTHMGGGNVKLQFVDKKHWKWNRVYYVHMGLLYMIICDEVLTYNASPLPIVDQPPL